jgi:hypothetical protein
MTHEDWSMMQFLEVENPMSVLRVSGLMLLPFAVCAQQPSKPTTAPVPVASAMADTVVKSATQILDENRRSIAVIVAAGNSRSSSERASF